MAALSAVRRARREGKKVGMLRLKTLWPFPDDAVRKLTASAKTIVVPEMNLGQVALEVERVVHGAANVVKLGKVNGELFHPDEVYAALKEAF
jgi:2-oxoglutarate ferredoxin oxidoreductase subunit alpha